MESANRDKTPPLAHANGIELAYETYGRKEDPPLLLIMGLGSQMVMWDEGFCSLLARRGFRVIRFDNRDVGLSTKFNHSIVVDPATVASALQRGESPGLPYTLSDMASDAAGLLEALGYEKAHIVGESMGGMIGQIMALERPQQVHTLTSIMSTTGDPTLPPPRPEVLEILYKPFPTDRQGYIRTFVEAMEVLNGPYILLRRELATKWAEQSFDRGLNPAGVARQYAAIMAAGDRTHRLKGMSVSTLVIHGDADPLLPTVCGQATAAAIPGAKLKIIPGMGHALPEAIWPEIVSAITDHAKKP
jgi:pimeloyl-ACP methyl ester carboxylesterase